MQYSYQRDRRGRPNAARGRAGSQGQVRAPAMRPPPGCWMSSDKGP